MGRTRCWKSHLFALFTVRFTTATTEVFCRMEGVGGESLLDSYISTSPFIFSLVTNYLQNLRKWQQQASGTGLSNRLFFPENSKNTKNTGRKDSYFPSVAKIPQAELNEWCFGYDSALVRLYWARDKLTELELLFSLLVCRWRYFVKLSRSDTLP